MKKRTIRTVLLLSGLMLLASCLKDDPDNNGTVYYGYQWIPNINEFMPQNLLQAMGQSNLYYGDEPPKLEGSYVADDIMLTDVILAPGSHYHQAPTPIPANQYFNFFEQHKGIAKLEFKYPKGDPNEYGYYLERSEPDSTYKYVMVNPEHFVNDSIAPVYFNDGNYQKEDFNTVYIVGHDPYFTAYYYEIRDISSNFQPLNAVILSGKLDKETIIQTDTVNHTTDTIVKPIIKDLVWGIETMKYYKEGASLSQILNLGYLPSSGDVILLRNVSNVHMGEFQE
ncbi:MAG: hypothetical protein IJ057_11000 [Bacteroidales bacterium]|nr:hypothetical protein [Bacteroidales bacterium]